MILSRRKFLGALGTAAALGQGERLRRQLEGLSVYGRPVGGTFADGVSRVAFSDADVAGRRYVMGLMKEAGLAPRIDPAGNIWGRREGSDAALPAVVFGSHIDSVPSGGNFDGDLGVLASIEVVRSLNEAKIRTRRPLEVVVWASEEGVAYTRGLWGSSAAAGRLVEGELEQVWNGVKKADAVRKIGGDPGRIGEARRAPGSFRGYLELHIEQGGTLEKEGIPIGVVEGIVTVARYEAVIRGFANHAGTTPMAERQDALVAAAHLTLAVNEVVNAEPGRQVGTVGQLTVAPNAPNVIPGLVRQTIELRDLSTAKVDRMAARVEERAREIAARTRTEIEIRRMARNEGASASPEMMTAVGSVGGTGAAVEAVAERGRA